LLYKHRQDEEGKRVRGSTVFENSTISFLVQEEIIPNPHTDFGARKSDYLPLKIKFLEGEQRTLRKIKEQEEKKLVKKKLDRINYLS
jgi:hypothetical protein